MYRNVLVMNGDSMIYPNFLSIFLPVFVPIPMSLIFKILLWKAIKYSLSFF